MAWTCGETCHCDYCSEISTATAWKSTRDALCQHDRSLYFGCDYVSAARSARTGPSPETTPALMLQVQPPHRNRQPLQPEPYRGAYSSLADDQRPAVLAHHLRQPARSMLSEGFLKALATVLFLHPEVCSPKALATAPSTAALCQKAFDAQSFCQAVALC
mmetsp:Transcript_47805/g.86005  ORF Transcript_47805/g.86005 Transcript_47805/m.86005 type:complete len:160 (+) Transcript_47805:171-650(+)